MTSSTLAEKVSTSRRLLERLFSEFRAPVIASSFGKDSMAMLHLVRSLRMDLPVLFFREPYFPRKYAFANRMIAEMDLTVHDFPPAAVALYRNPEPTTRERLDFVHTYTLRGAALANAFGAYEPAPGEKFLCGVNDVLMRPKGELRAATWDLVLIGSKRSDRKPQGSLEKLAFDVKRDPALTLAFPLRCWSDEDVWAFLETEGVPIDGVRYERTAEGWREREDLSGNADRFPVCTRCLDDMAPSAVVCPLNGGCVNNLSAIVPWQKGPPCDYFASTPVRDTR